MTNIRQLLFTLVNALLKLGHRGGVKSLVAENLCLRQQLLILTKNRERAPNLSNWDRMVFSICTSYINFKRLKRLAILLKPETILKFHRAFVAKKYSKLYSRKTPNKPGPKGPTQEVIDLVLAMKTRNPSFGSLRIAMQISNLFKMDLKREVVRHILKKHYKGNPDDHSGPSWLSFVGHMKDSLWSVDLFLCASINIKSHWVMLIMDQYTRRIVGFAVHKGNVSGADLCCMFNSIIAGKKLPKRMSSDNDLLFLYHRWQANLRIMEIEEIQTVPYTPISHPYVEKLIGTIRQEYLNKFDLQMKLNSYQAYYNNLRSHSAIESMTPNNKSRKVDNVIDITNFKWKQHLRGLVQLPTAA